MMESATNPGPLGRFAGEARSHTPPVGAGPGRETHGSLVGADLARESPA